MVKQQGKADITVYKYPQEQMSRSVRNFWNSKMNFPRLRCSGLWHTWPNSWSFVGCDWLGQRKGKEQKCVVQQVKRIIQICSMFRWAPGLHDQRSYWQCSARYRSWRQDFGAFLQLLFPLGFSWQQQLQMWFNWDSFRLIVQMKKSCSCYCTTLRARKTVHHSSVTTINTQFALNKGWMLKLYLISCPFHSLK